MEEDHLDAENTIEDVGIGGTNNVLENKIEEDVIGATDEDDVDDDISAYNGDDK